MVSSVRSFGTYLQEQIEVGFTSLGKSVDKIRNDHIPEGARAISHFAHTLLKSYYFVLPGVALTLGHYGDALAASAISLVSLGDWFLKDSDCREASALMVGVPLGIAIIMQSEQFVTTNATFAFVGLTLKTISLAKLVLIARGENY